MKLNLPGRNLKFDLEAFPESVVIVPGKALRGWFWTVQLWMGDHAEHTYFVSQPEYPSQQEATSSGEAALADLKQKYF